MTAVGIIELEESAESGCDELYGDEDPPCYDMCQDSQDEPSD